MYRSPAHVTSDRTALHCSSLSDSAASVATPKSRRATTTGATSSAVCRRLQFGVDHDVDGDRQRSPGGGDSPETVLDYVERLYDDTVARWNMDFRTMTPLNGGRWRWTRVVTSQPVPADDHVDDSRSPASRNTATTKRRRRMNGE